MMKEIAAGDAVFYSNNILHTANYSPAAKRATLHGCMGDTRGGSGRARMILQHGLRWMRSADMEKTFEGEEGERERLIAMHQRLLEMENSGADEELRYSQVG